MMSMYHGKTVLITGAAGYLGSALAETMSAFPCQLVLLVHQAQPPTLPVSCTAKCSVIQGDASKKDVWQKAIGGTDYVFHLAAFEHRRGSPFDPVADISVNCLAVLHLLEACRQTNARPRIIFASTSNIAGLPPSLPVNERTPDNPLTLFAIHKLTSERYLRHYAREFRVESIALRLPNIFGVPACQSAPGHSVLNRMIQRALDDQPLFLFKNAGCIRDYLFIDDVVSAFLAAGVCRKAADGHPFVVGSGSAVTLKDVAMLIVEKVAAATGRTPSINLDDTATLEAVEWRNFVADPARFSELTGWSPQVSLSEGVERTIKQFLHPRKI